MAAKTARPALGPALLLLYACGCLLVVASTAQGEDFQFNRGNSGL